MKAQLFIILSGGIRLVRLLLALLAVALPVSLYAGDDDVQGVEILKIHDLIQTSTADPVDDINPYAFYTQSNDSDENLTLITSVDFLPPGGVLTGMSGNGSGEFDFEQTFATKAAMDAAFPNGTYNFTVQTTNAPFTYSPSLDLSGDTYPVAPKLSNIDWVSGKLQFDPAVDYTFNWNLNAGNGAKLTISFGSEDNDVFVADGSQLTSATLFAGTLAPNTDYIAVISFGSGSNISDGPTTLFAGFDTFTHFEIHTIPEPSAALLLIGAIGVCGMGRRVRR